MPEQIIHCSFCDKHKDMVGKLIVGHGVAICNECVDLCGNLLKDITQTTLTGAETVPDPRNIKDFLDQHIIGQDRAKMVLSVAVTNHFKRLNSGNTEIQKSNILLAGPTGTGKTLLAKTVARYLGVPCVIADSTTLTEAGYVGDDVESLISKLYAAADYDVKKCEHGIIFLDEVDKIARKGESATISRDVSGEGVQQALLKLVEGTKCKITPPGSRKGHGDTIEIDTTNILFIAGGAFVGVDSIIQKRLQGTAMGFSANIGTTAENTMEYLAPDDLVKYGMIPEFVGRFGNCVSLQNLTQAQLIEILTKVKHNLVEQYCWLFNQDGVELEFDPHSLELIANIAHQSNTGARGLQNELERILLPHMFDLPSYQKQNILRVVIDKNQVNTPMTLLKENS